jgi:hypothetical protein
MTRVNITGPVSIRAQGIIKDGAELLRIPVFPGDPPLYEKVGFTFDIALDKAGPGRGRVARVLLNNLYAFVREEVVTKLQPFFPE